MMQNIEKIIHEILVEMGVDSNFIVEIPSDLNNGEYSTNVALTLSKVLNDSPSSVADTIIEKLNEKDLKNFSKIEKAGPGFINFHLSSEAVQDQIKNLEYKNENLKGKNILIEFTDPNPFKQFHIGHMMSNTIGESLSRIYEANGAEVKRLCYSGDTGLHVAKAIWGITQNKEFFPQDQDSLEDKAKYLGDSYVYGSKEYEENKDVKEEIDNLNKTLFENKNVDIEIQTYYAKGKKWSLEYFNKMYALLGTKFDKFYLETQTAPLGLQVVEENTSRSSSMQEGKVFEESEGAIVYKGEQDGLHTRVFINSKGVPTYETKDLGLIMLKDKDFEYDKSIIITGNEQDQYFRVMFAAMSKIHPEIVSKSQQMSHGMLRFADRKMSSRTGDVITAEDLIEQVKASVAEKMADRDLTDKEKEEIQDFVSIGALKYSILKQSIGKDIVFDFEKSVSYEGDSGPYLQYAYTRAKSILEKAPRQSSGQTSADVWKTTDLEKTLIQFQDVLKQSFEDLAPQLIVTYLTKLASEFNSFYANTKILDVEDLNMSYKLVITKAVQDTLKEGLNILGIKVPSKM